MVEGDGGAGFDVDDLAVDLVLLQRVLQGLGLLTHEFLELLVEPDLGLFEQFHGRELVSLERHGVLEVRQVLVGCLFLALLGEADGKLGDLLAQVLVGEDLRGAGGLLVFLFVLVLVLVFFDRLGHRTHNPLGLGLALGFALFLLVMDGLDLDHLVVDVVDADHDGLASLGHHGPETRKQPPAGLERALAGAFGRGVGAQGRRLGDHTGLLTGERQCGHQLVPDRDGHRDDILVAADDQPDDRGQGDPQQRPKHGELGQQGRGPHHAQRPADEPGQRPGAWRQHLQQHAQGPGQDQRPAGTHDGLGHGAAHHAQGHEHADEEHGDDHPEPERAQQPVTDMGADGPGPVLGLGVGRVDGMRGRISTIEAHEPHEHEEPQHAQGEPTDAHEQLLLLTGLGPLVVHAVGLGRFLLLDRLRHNSALSVIGTQSPQKTKGPEALILPVRWAF